MRDGSADRVAGRAEKSSGSLAGRNLYIPRMSVEGASVFAAAFRAYGVNGRLVPPGDARSLDLARQYTFGEECYPEIVTLGSFLKVIDDRDFKPERTAFLLPTANGPCRFGQYRQILQEVLEQKGLHEVMVVSPTSANGYEGMGDYASDLARLGWWALVCGDALRKLLLQTRPYERNAGETDRVHAESLDALCSVIEVEAMQLKEKFQAIIDVMDQIGRRFAAIPADYIKDKPLVGVIGEIYCRLDDFANSQLIRRIEKFGGETWLASIAEWFWYTNFMHKHDLKLAGRTISKEMLGVVIKNKFQENDERKLLEPLGYRFEGYGEPHSIARMLEPAKPYLPYWGSLGEMVLNVGGAIHLYEAGADGVVDISPFTCMNGIISEAIYPRVSQDHDGMPIRSFYFDGTEGDYDRDVEIFLELASTYMRRKKKTRRYPTHFTS
jgi:predicted nucleotide-binding protein (sugar kinase/HSP70/actin superfamily)